MSEYDTRLMSYGAKRKDTFHSTEACPKVRNPERLTERPESYVEFHGATPCEYCHDVESGCRAAAAFSLEGDV